VEEEASRSNPDPLPVYIYRYMRDRVCQALGRIDVPEFVSPWDKY
jgi:hypothetical protein